MGTTLDQIRENYPAGSIWVIKIGSSLLTRNGQGLAKDAMADWVSQIAALHAEGLEGHRAASDRQFYVTFGEGQFQRDAEGLGGLGAGRDTQVLDGAASE